VLLMACMVLAKRADETETIVTSRNVTPIKRA
jgi:hypothetical protein